MSCDCHIVSLGDCNRLDKDPLIGEGKIGFDSCLIPTHEKLEGIEEGVISEDIDRKM